MTATPLEDTLHSSAKKRNAAFLTVSGSGSGSRRQQHVNGERTQKSDAWNFEESTFDSSIVRSGK
jgi:hypothetical protein